LCDRLAFELAQNLLHILRSAADLGAVGQQAVPEREKVMHVHTSQPNPYAQVDTIRSAQRAAAKREAEMVRKELLDSASELAGDADFNDLRVEQAEERQESQRQSKKRNTQNGKIRQKGLEPKADDSEEVGKHISDWA
jgi:hypothetical protein